MKIIVTIIPTNLVANSILFLFCLFVQKQEPKFQQVGDLVTRNISAFCLLRVALYFIVYRIQQIFIKGFSDTLFLFVLQFHEEMKEKSVIFCFFKLKAKEKAKFSKIIEGRATFLWRIQVSPFKVNVNLLTFLLKPQAWSSGNIKQEIITRN